MLEGIIHRFVLRHIKKHMSHEHQKKRSDILQAVNDGMAFHFNEDNVHTRLYSTVRWLVNNDTAFKQLDQSGDKSFRVMAACNVSDAVLEYDDTEQGPRT